MTENIDIEGFFDLPYWVIDPLPRQVPYGAAGQFFEIERCLLSRPNSDALSQRHANLVLALNCYHEILVSDDADSWTRNPEPSRLAALIQECRTGVDHSSATLYVIVREGGSPDALLVADRDSINLTLYGPSKDLLGLVRALAQAQGLFVWAP